MDNKIKIRKLKELMEASPKEYCLLLKKAFITRFYDKGEGRELDNLFIKKIKNNAKRVKILSKK